ACRQAGGGTGRDRPLPARLRRHHRLDVFVRPEGGRNLRGVLADAAALHRQGAARVLSEGDARPLSHLGPRRGDGRGRRRQVSAGAAEQGAARRAVPGAAAPAVRAGLRAYVPEPVNDFGGGLMIWPPAGATFITASPRWLLPSGRKRNSPSMPVKPDELVSTVSEKRCWPWVLASAATSATAS